MIQLDSSQQTIETKTATKVVQVTSTVSRWLPSILYPLARHFVIPFYFGQIQVTGQEHIPRSGPVILAPTHRARWDAIVVPHTTGRPTTDRDLRFMVSANEMQGLQGWFIRRMGGFPVDTDQPGIGSFRHGVELLEQGEMVVIFPEGGIFQDGRVHPLKRGLACIALNVESSNPGLGVKIVPISIRYSHQIPRWRCDVKVSIGTPLNVADYYTASTEGCRGLTARQSSQKLTTDLEAALKHLDGSEAIAHSKIQALASLKKVPSGQS